ncbi:MAG: hypothetical protein NTX44_12540 [Ignavibacteriales bacterium]|nr:hypothetical protein [Ignavibacteriales bacterium]
MIRRTVVLFIGSIFWIIPSISQTKSPQNNHEIFLTVQNTVQNFLEGKSDNQVLMIVSDSLFSETTPSKVDLQKTYEGCHFFFFKLVVSAEANTAVMALKTTTVANDVRFHTFALMKNKDGVWGITSWHSSH